MYVDVLEQPSGRLDSGNHRLADQYGRLESPGKNIDCRGLVTYVYRADDGNVC